MANAVDDSTINIVVVIIIIVIIIIIIMLHDIALLLPTNKLSTIGSQAFLTLSYQKKSITSFRRHLKTFLFQKSFCC